MRDRLERLTSALGLPAAQADHGGTQGWAWRVEQRILLIYARGRASMDGAIWATDEMDRIVADEYAARGRRVYIAWSFEDIEGFRPAVGLHFIDWFKDNRVALNRLMVFTENSIIRMTAHATSIAFPPGSLLVPESAAEFDRGMDGWAQHLRARAGQASMRHVASSS
jgi:hypothetical protein